jgi:hypothetical protein
MNHRKALLKEIINGFPENPLKTQYVEIITDELHKYKDNIPKNKYKIIIDYLLLVIKPTCSTKDINKMYELQPKIIKIIDNNNLSDDYYSSDDDIQSESDNEENTKQKYINQIRNLQHENKILTMESNYKNELIKSRESMITADNKLINELKLYIQALEQRQ